MPAAKSLIGLAVVALGLSACDQEQQTAQVPPPQPPEQVQQSAGVQQGGPAKAAHAFFQLLRAGKPAEAAAYVSRDLLVVSEAEMLDSMKLWADEVAIGQNEYAMIDSRRSDGYAMVITRFKAPETPETVPVLRPVVMVQEQGQWKVVWDLLGKQPDQVAISDRLAQQVQPLYQWFEERQQALTSQADGPSAG